MLSLTAQPAKFLATIQVGSLWRGFAEADADARIIAARAVTLAVNEGKSAADILERWQLRIEDGEQGSAVYLAEREENVTFEQAMYKSKLDTLENFVNDIFNNPEDTSARYFANLSNSGVNFDIPRDTVLHDKKHSLTAKEWTEVASNIDNIESAALSSKKRFDGQSVLMKVATPNGKYGVVFEHMKSGRNIVTTAFKDTDANIDNWIKNNSARAMQTASTTQKGLLSSRSMSDIISVLDDNVNDTLHKLPQAAYGADGKADINTPEFKRWSGSVDVVAPSAARNYDFQTGKPVAVEGFHGSRIKNIEVFDNKDVKTKSEGRGFYFTDRKDSAATYGNEIYNVYLSMKNPFVVDYKNKFYHQPVEADGITFSGKDTGYSATSVPSMTDVAKYAQEHGYDGVVAKNVVDSGNLAKLGYTANMGRRKELSKLPEDELYSLYKEVDGTDLPIEQARSGFGLSKRDFKKYMAGIIEQAERAKNISTFAQTDYIVFSPNQIKSVYNRGTFDPASDNIYYQGQVVDNGCDVELTIDSREETGGLSEDDFKLKMLEVLKSFKGKKILISP